jgi:hypothetical protein
MLAVVPVTAKVRGRDVADGVTATSRARARCAAPACPVRGSGTGRRLAATADSGNVQESGQLPCGSS